MKTHCFCECHSIQNFGWDQKTRECEHCSTNKKKTAGLIKLIYTTLSAVLLFGASAFMAWLFYMAPCSIVKQFWYVTQTPGRCL